jgi:glycogen phosphorylase
MGRTLDNALLNLGMKDAYKESISQLGFVSWDFLLVLLASIFTPFQRLEDLIDNERDAALGNGGSCVST